MHRPGAFSIPPAPLALTLAGLLPFVAAATAVGLLREDIAGRAAAELILLAYAAVILSFLGGVRWGIEIARSAPPRWAVLGLSVLGALAGWAMVLHAVLRGQSPWLLAVAAGLLALHWAWDVFAAREAPAWYGGLRTLASLGAVLSLLAAFALRLAA